MTISPLPAFGALDDFQAILAANDRMYRERHRDWFDRVAKFAKAASPVQAPSTQWWQVDVQEATAGTRWPRIPGPVNWLPHYDENERLRVEATAQQVRSPAPRPAGALLYSPSGTRPRPGGPAQHSRPRPPRQSSGLPPVTIPLLALALGFPLAESHLSPRGHALADDYLTSLGFVVGIIALMRRRKG